MTRTTGSVPLSRSSSRPVPASLASACETALRLTDAASSGDATAEPHAAQFLRQRRERAQHLACRPAVIDQDRKHLQCREQAVAGRRVVGEDDVAGLLAAHVQPAQRAFPRPRSGHPPGCGATTRPETGQEPLQAEVRHHRRHHAAAAQPPVVCSRSWRSGPGSGRRRRSCAALVAHDQPVGVAVERQAEMGTVAPAPRRTAVAGTVEPQSRLMLNPSGATPIGTTSAPSSHRMVGATLYAAPCAQSTTILRPSSRRPRGRVALALSM